jgi:excisionase family DNA binding protein
VATQHKSNLPEQEVRRWLSVGLAAEYLDCHPQSVRTLLHSGALRCSAVGGTGGQLRIDREDLDKLLERRKIFLPNYRKGSKPHVRKSKPWLRSHVARRRNVRRKQDAAAHI